MKHLVGGLTNSHRSLSSSSARYSHRRTFSSNLAIPFITVDNSVNDPRVRVLLDQACPITLRAKLQIQPCSDTWVYNTKIT